MKRKEGEDFEDYRERRLKEQKRLKVYLRGRVFWDSKNLGTYRNPNRIHRSNFTRVTDFLNSQKV